MTAVVNTSYYCTPDDVSKFMQLGFLFDDTTTNPSLTQVYSLINANEDHFDKKTNHHEYTDTD